MINYSTASSKDVDDGQADKPANIQEATDSDKELEKERQERSKSGELRSKNARVKSQAETLTDWQTRHAWLIRTRRENVLQNLLKAKQKEFHDRGNQPTQGIDIKII